MNAYAGKTTCEMLVNLITRPQLVLDQLRGRGYKKKFEKNGHTILRPEHFWNDGTRQAFHWLGWRICDESRSNEILYTDPIFTLSFVTHRDWRQVIDYFIQEGWLECRWQLYLSYRTRKPTRYDFQRVYECHANCTHISIASREEFFVPKHAADGTSLVLPLNDRPWTDELLSQVELWPSYLTDEQKTQLLGKPYRIFADSDPCSQNENLPQEKTVTEGCFKVRYLRKF